MLLYFFMSQAKGFVAYTPNFSVLWIKRDYLFSLPPHISVKRLTVKYIPCSLLDLYMLALIHFVSLKK